MSSLPIRPAIAPAFIIRDRRPLRGPIKPGHIFAWEPDIPHARELVVVTRVEGDSDDARIWSRPIDGDNEVWNTVDRFREAAYATIMNPHPIKRPTVNDVAWPFPPIGDRVPGGF